MLPIIRIFAEILNFCSPGNFCTWFFNFKKKKSASKFFSLKFCFCGKKMIYVSIFRKQNGSWTRLRKKNKKNCRRKWRPNSSAQGEPKQNGVQTHLKEDKKDLNKPQTSISSLIRFVLNESNESCGPFVFHRYAWWFECY